MSNEELRQVHKIQPVVRQVFVEDPQTGAQNIQQRNQFIEDSTSVVTGSDGRVWEIQPDKSFYVPLDLAAHLVRMPGWDYGPNPFYDPDDEDEDKPRSAARKPQARAKAA